MHRTAYFWRWLFLCVLLLVSRPDITVLVDWVKHQVTVTVSCWLPLYTMCRTACFWRLLFLHSLLVVAHTGYPVKSCFCTWCAGSPVNVLAGRHWGEHEERHHLVPALWHGSRGARAAGTGRAAESLFHSFHGALGGQGTCCPWLCPGRHYRSFGNAHSFDAQPLCQGSVDFKLPLHFVLTSCFC